jgi:hypothetical protein
MSLDQMPTPEWDQLIAERGGRGPTEFEGHDTWDDSEEARQAYARGVAEAQATQDAFWGRADAASAGSASAAEPAPVGTSSDRVSSAGKPAKQPAGKSSATTTAGANGASDAANTGGGRGSTGAGTKATRTRTKPAGKGAGAS